MSEKKIDKNLKSQREGKKPWVDIRRSVSRVPEDLRVHPRLEFHCPARIKGLKGVFKITDISMGGAFLELKPGPNIKVGQTFNLVMKLPTEYDPINMKAKIANIRKRGIGIEFVEVSQKKQEIIRFCFETFKDTIPLR
jgi:c-di-GMP-binding flagellar brake protein YcgR